MPLPVADRLFIVVVVTSLSVWRGTLIPATGNKVDPTKCEKTSGEEFDDPWRVRTLEVAIQDRATDDDRNREDDELCRDDLGRVEAL